MVSESVVVGKVAFTIPKIGWITIGINEFSSFFASFVGSVPSLLIGFGDWLFGVGVYFVSALSLIAFSAFYFVNWKSQRRGDR